MVASPPLPELWALVDSAPLPHLPRAFVARVLDELTRGPDAIWLAPGLAGAVIDTCASRDDVADLVLLAGVARADHAPDVLAHAERVAAAGPRRSLEVALTPALAPWRPTLVARGYHHAYSMFTLERSLAGPLEASPAPGTRWEPIIEARVGALYALVVEAFAELPGAMVPPLPEFTRHALSHEPPAELLVHAAGAALAFLRLTLTGHERGELSSLGVTRAARGQGLGHAVVTRGLARLHALGARHATLEVAATNERATALYRRHGFAITAETPVYRLPLR